MCHVLIIEDEALIAAQIELMLAAEGATSFSFAVTEQEAVAQAQQRRPEIMTADVRSLEGTGPRAVAEIIRLHGHIPTIFITGTPEECVPCDHPHRIHRKPIVEPEVIASFKAMAPL